MTIVCGSSDIFQKDPDAVKDYKFDWKALTNGSGPSDWLQDGESIVSFTLTASPDTITVSNAALTDDNTSITFWLTGGTLDVVYDILCHIVTDSLPVNREEDKTAIIEIVQQ